MRAGRALELKLGLAGLKLLWGKDTSKATSEQQNTLEGMYFKGQAYICAVGPKPF